MMMVDGEVHFRAHATQLVFVLLFSQLLGKPVLLYRVESLRVYKDSALP